MKEKVKLKLYYMDRDLYNQYRYTVDRYIKELKVSNELRRYEEFTHDFVSIIAVHEAKVEENKNIDKINNTMVEQTCLIKELKEIVSQYRRQGNVTRQEQLDKWEE